MRIGICRQLEKAHNHGVGNCISGLVQALLDGAPTGAELVLYNARGATTVRASRAERGTSLTDVALPRLTRFRVGRVLWEQVTLPLRARRDRLDLLHCPAYTRPILSRVPNVLTVYDVLAFTHPEFCTLPNRAHYRMVVPASISGARRVIVPSTRVAEQVCARFRYPRERVCVIPPGIDRRFRAPVPQERISALRARLGLSRPFALFSGNPEPKKNLPRLVQAFQLLGERGVELDLVLAGGVGWERTPGRFARVAGVHCVGFLDVADLAVLVRTAHVFVFPSLQEGFGIPVIEALAAGVPVVSARVPAVEEAGLDSVLLLAPESSESIADAVQRAVEDSALRTELGRRGVASSRRFTWEASARETWKTYRAALAD